MASLPSSLALQPLMAESSLILLFKTWPSSFSNTHLNVNSKTFSSSSHHRPMLGFMVENEVNSTLELPTLLPSDTGLSRKLLAHHTQEKSCTKDKEEKGSLSLSLSYCLTSGVQQYFPLYSPPHIVLCAASLLVEIKSYLVFSSLVCLCIHSYEQPYHVFNMSSGQDKCKRFLDSPVSSTITSLFSCKAYTTHWQSISCPKTVHKIAG